MRWTEAVDSDIMAVGKSANPAEQGFTQVISVMSANFESRIVNWK